MNLRAAPRQADAVTAQDAAPLPAVLPLLSVQHLETSVTVGGQHVPVVNDVSFDVRRGETLALIGESGCGKSLTALSILRCLPPAARIVSGRVWFDGADLVREPERRMREVRGARIGFVCQEPSTALNPVFTIGDQIAEMLVVHGRAPRADARRRAVEWLERVSIPEPHRRADEYPHQLSGGLRQRALIALALACQPALLIADEPTTALDVTIQAEILELLARLQREFDLALLLITHDLGVVAHAARRVAVMYAGRLVEEAAVDDLYDSPSHPYTRALFASMPGLTPGRPLVAIEGRVPSPGAPRAGCDFAPRCPFRFDPCTADVPPAFAVASSHTARCFLHASGPCTEFPRVP